MRDHTVLQFACDEFVHRHARHPIRLTRIRQRVDDMRKLKRQRKGRRADRVQSSIAAFVLEPKRACDAAA